MGVLRPLSKNQRSFLKVVDDYSGIADNGNLMSELGWERTKVAAVGRTLIRRGIVTYVATGQGGFEGGIWEKVKRDDGTARREQKERKTTKQRAVTPSPQKHILLSVYWSTDGDEDRFIQQGKVTADIGKIGSPPTDREMQNVMFAAKTALVKEINSRKTR